MAFGLVRLKINAFKNGTVLGLIGFGLAIFTFQGRVRILLPDRANKTHRDNVQC